MSMFEFPETIVLFDTEYTSWDGAQARRWSGPNEYKEIVEIGAVLIETKTFSEQESFGVYVKPIKNPLLSDYFISLTGITQNAVDREGIDYASALKKFAAWLGERSAYSYGTDFSVMKENAELIGIPLPLNAAHFFNIKDVFKRYGIPADEYMSSTIVRAFGLEPVRRGHSAINDARTIVDGLRALRDREMHRGAP